MEPSDVCVSQSQPEASLFDSLDMTQDDINAVVALCYMAKHKNDLNSVSPPPSPTKRTEKTEVRPKRPMNGFMLFAKKFRVEYTQMYPGKDNRAISVLLGDKWKKMRSEERTSYAEEARLLAEEQKKIHPDCWKRKRSLSSS